MLIEALNHDYQILTNLRPTNVFEVHVFIIHSVKDNIKIKNIGGGLKVIKGCNISFNSNVCNERYDYSDGSRIKIFS